MSDLAAFVLEREVDVARRVALELGDFAADADAAEGGFQRAFHGARDFGDGEFGEIGEDGVGLGFRHGGDPMLEGARG